MSWRWWKLDNNNKEHGIITTTMAIVELINIQTNGAEAIETIAITRKIWT